MPKCPKHLRFPVHWQHVGGGRVGRVGLNEWWRGHRHHVHSHPRNRLIRQRALLLLQGEGGHAEIKDKCLKRDSRRASHLTPDRGDHPGRHGVRKADRWIGEANVSGQRKGPEVLKKKEKEKEKELKKELVLII